MTGDPQGRASRFAALFGDVPVERFLREHWDHEALVQHGPVARYPFLGRQPELTSLDRLLAAHTGPISAYWVDEVGALRELELDGEQARVLVDADFCLMLMELERWAGPVMDFVRGLARELGLPTRRIRTSMFVAPPGGELRMHFDQVHVVSMQLVGKKVWRIAPNQEIRHPHEGHSPPGGLHPALQAIATAAPPVEMPADARVVEAGPGTTLFLPRGWWHTTRVDALSISLSIGFEPPAWADVISDGLRARLMQEEAFRESAWTGAGMPWRRAQATERVASLLEQAARDVRALSPDALVDAMDRDDGRDDGRDG